MLVNPCWRGGGAYDTGMPLVVLLYAVVTKCIVVGVAEVAQENLEDQGMQAVASRCICQRLSCTHGVTTVVICSDPVIVVLCSHP